MMPLMERILGIVCYQIFLLAAITSKQVRKSPYTGCFREHETLNATFNIAVDDQINFSDFLYFNNCLVGDNWENEVE